ncbi:hypothetical protein TTHERM_00218970 (macronuclear) [Tetrahymena thermophila SB210]|uniref:Uncharacterized protein n=1 Tax=Tetrahymena thermophila (strain SB210) TaxID=312017 RepID=I7M2G1_TETTS|nr:hypothetical protein TTHERM_00218970 [Tetrahymena thermophila SB210]EAS00324.2 hypothetical protein TTHERM_00218970 [Tetrahymena thermophila SB210]|eukprot:XP_001020569.2 hypothetical protein TTHERM_00218970 [Tetrahymena thermophila SB210]
MNQQFINRQYQLRTIPNNQQQGYNLAINSIPSYTPLLHGSSKLNNIPPFQQVQNQQKLNQPQLMMSPGPNQKHFLQNVPLVQSLPQNYTTSFNFSPQQTQKVTTQKTLSPNQVMSNTSSANFYSSNKEQQQNALNNLTQQHIQSINNAYSSSKQLFLSPSNTHSNSSQKDQEKSQENNQNQKNSEQNRPNSQGSNNNEILNTQPSTKTNSVNQSQFQKQQQFPQVQKTPDRATQKSPNFSYLSPSLFYLSEKKVEQAVNSAGNLKQTQNQQKPSGFNSPTQKFNTENIEIQQSQHQNVNSTKKEDKYYLNTLQSIVQKPQNQIQTQKDQSQLILQTKTTLNDSKDDQTINEEGEVLQISQAPKLAQNDISKQGQSNLKIYKNNLIEQKKLKIPLELTYDGNQIIEGNQIQCQAKSNYASIQTNTLTETNDRYPDSLYYTRSTQNQINQSRQKILSIREEESDLINNLREQIKQLTHENTNLKKELFDQRQEYKILQSSHYELERKYIYLQNQIVLPTSSCNSSLIIFQEDKNQQILYDIANNCSSLTKIQSKNSFTYPYNQNSNSQLNKMSFKREASPTNPEYIHQSQNQQTINKQFFSPQANTNNNNLEHNSQLYNSINIDSQLFSSNLPSYIQKNNQNFQQNREEDYNYKKVNNSKLDGGSSKVANFVQNKSKTQEEQQNNQFINSKINLNKVYQQDMTNSHTQYQINQIFNIQSERSYLNEQYTQQKSPSSNQANKQPEYISKTPTTTNNNNNNNNNKISNNYSQLDIQEAIKKADEILRKSHYVPNQTNQNDFVIKRATTQYIQQPHK